MINSVKSADDLKSVFNMFKVGELQFSSYAMNMLIQKAGVFHKPKLLQEMIDHYLLHSGYDAKVTNQAIYQYSKARKVSSISSLYHSLTAMHVVFSQSTCESFLSSLLAYPHYERICLNIMKSMLRLHYTISRRFLIQCLDDIGTRSSDMVIALLTISNPRELTFQHMQTILNDKIIGFSAVNRQVSVWELYKYLCLLAPSMDKTKLIPYLSKSLQYFISRCVIE